MKISKLNIAVLVQLAGLILFLFFSVALIRYTGILLLITGGILYRREQKRLKLTSVTGP